MTKRVGSSRYESKKYLCVYYVYENVYVNLYACLYVCLYGSMLLYIYINIELTPIKIGTALQIFEHGHILI